MDTAPCEHQSEPDRNCVPFSSITTTSAILMAATFPPTTKRYVGTPVDYAQKKDAQEKAATLSTSASVARAPVNINFGGNDRGR